MRQRGFTLIEAVVSAAVFAMVVSSIIAIYISAAKIDRRTRAQRVVVQNSRYILDFIAKEVRNGHINYAAYPGGDANEIDQLHVINQAGDTESFNLVGNNCGAAGVCKITMTKNAATTDLTGSSVKITKLEFRHHPERDPFATPPQSDEQPSVSIILEISSNTGQRVEDQSKLLIQSTFSERYYPSRQ